MSMSLIPRLVDRVALLCFCVAALIATIVGHFWFHVHLIAFVYIALAALVVMAPVMIVSSRDQMRPPRLIYRMIGDAFAAASARGAAVFAIGLVKAIFNCYDW